MQSRLQVNQFSILEIPKNFNLQNYDLCKKWGLDEWSRAIHRRVELKRHWNKSVRKMYDVIDIDSEYRCHQQYAINLIESSLEFFRNPPDLISRKYITDQSVADLFEDADDERLRSSSWMTDYAEWSGMAPFSRYETEHGIKLSKRIESTPSWVLKKQEWGLYDRATIHVDVTGEHADVVKDFSSWLKKTQKAMKIPRTIKVYDHDVFSDWHNDRVLPCFDLLFYKTIFNGRFKSSDFLEALFPLSKSLKDTNVDAERISKTIIPNAKKIVSSTTDIALRRALNPAK